MRTKVTISTAVAALMAVSSFATQVAINGHPNYRTGPGGEFNVRAADAGGAALLAPALGGYFVAGGTSFPGGDGTRLSTGFGGQNGYETFCIEFNEHIALSGTYDASISLGAIYGGVAGGIDHDSNPLTPTTDIISLGTAYLYQRFANGSLAGAGYIYADGAGRAAQATVLQNAIWYLEDEISYAAAGGAGNAYLNLAASVFGGLANAKANNNLFAVAALNLGGVDPNQKQDQLILHDNGFHVPDGGMTVMLLGVGLTGLGLLRRKLA
jgi:hypothetical protein